MDMQRYKRDFLITNILNELIVSENRVSVFDMEYKQLLKIYNKIKKEKRKCTN